MIPKSMPSDLIRWVASGFRTRSCAEKGRRSAERRMPTMSAQQRRMSPSADAFRAAARRSRGRARLPALHRGTRQRLLPRWLSPRTGFPQSTAKRVFCPLAAQRFELSTLRADRSFLPADRCPGAARERIASIRARAPHPAPLSESALAKGALGELGTTSLVTFSRTKVNRVTKLVKNQKGKHDTMQLLIVPSPCYWFSESRRKWWARLELAFETLALRDICESEERARQKLGIKVAAGLKRRLSDFQAVESFDELPTARPKKNSNSCVFPLPEGWQLVVTGGHGSNPTLPSGRIDWTKVSRLKILRIEKANA
jgi:hypothetical protein